MNQDMLHKIEKGQGFIAALDQSGGSTPKALGLYGIGPERYSNDEEMFELMHAMRTRIITSPVFTGERVIGAILFERTMDSQIEGSYSADYLWNTKQIVPFLKIDKGLENEADGVQPMKPMPGLDALLARGNDRRVFGTKERSVIKLADSGGITSIVDQQFDVARQVLAAGLVPIIEPEVDIKSPEKPEAEKLLVASILDHLGALGPDQLVMLKLTLPESNDLYDELVQHPNVLRVVALSGGYSRQEACERLAGCKGVIASFSRALTEGLSDEQSDDEFNRTLDAAIDAIYRASIT
jgi:fructose-bisphosphate aldolase class I